MQDLHGKTAFVTGGSGGLGRTIATALAVRGAHVTIFARKEGPLAEAKAAITAKALSKEQEINAIAIDMANATQVDETFKSQPRTADILYCVAGGNHAENGFLVDIKSSDLDTCMRNNYFAAAYAAQSLLRIWTLDDKKHEFHRDSSANLRQIIFINSAGAFLGLPGSIAYTPAKCALRNLADTLRMEVLRYNCSRSTYTIHSAFPADFMSPGFILEQKTKTALNKKLQGIAPNADVSELESRYPSSEKIASLVISAVDRGDFIICPASFGASALFCNMVGPSPKRGWGIVDSLFTVLTGWFVWPILRRKWEAICRKDGEEYRCDGIV